MTLDTFAVCVLLLQGADFVVTIKVGANYGFNDHKDNFQKVLRVFLANGC
jgi:hypothetical protein